jgi:mannosyltransferase
MPENPLAARPAGRPPEGGGASRQPRWRPRPDWLVVAGPAAAALAVGGYRLGGPSLWRDEAFTISASQRSIGRIFPLLWHVDAVHGPYYLGLHFVVSLLGTSAVALRLPSVLGMGVAAGFTAAVGRRLARTVALPAPAVTGLLAGLLFAAAPQTTYYAQDARPYGPVIMFAVIATYLLIRATGDGRWRWWAAYGAAIALTGLFNLFALLLVAAHGVTLLQAAHARRAARAREADGPGPPGAGPPRTSLARWLVVVAAAVIALGPMLYLGYQQGHTLGWVTRPGPRTFGRLVTLFAGSKPLIPLVTVLALAGILAGWRSRRPGQLTLTGVALPWLVLPPLILLLVSRVHPVYVERYVVFCLPALALLCAAGLAGLARLAAATLAAATPASRPRPVLCWLPSAAVLAVLAVLLIAPQQAVRRVDARPDNLRAAAAIVAANAQPGDVIFFIPTKTRVLRLAYPAAFARIRDLALAQSPVASDTLLGTQVTPSVLRRRFAGVHAAWVVRWRSQRSRRPAGPIGRAELQLAQGLHLIRRWDVQTIELSLYATRAAARSAR